MGPQGSSELQRSTSTEGLNEEQLALLHKQADSWPGTLKSPSSGNVNEEGPFLNAGQLRARATNIQCLMS